MNRRKSKLERHLKKTGSGDNFNASSITSLNYKRSSPFLLVAVVAVVGMMNIEAILSFKSHFQKFFLSAFFN